ncbi:methyltransferase-like protein 25B [Tigriopus californicus]|uniref:methyltransferase-like protein 25B n=1 Tax=Tigriopus californicus TaxID=6832 RepID=UPI0027DAAEB3|nr:methyltransferase-like protein 25B [Tigriopus californicus]
MDRLLQETQTWLGQFEWLFGFSNVDILSRCAQMPSSWIRWLEAVHLADLKAAIQGRYGSDMAESNLPHEVQAFFLVRCRLQDQFRAHLCRNILEQALPHPTSSFVLHNDGIPAKKRHEITRLSQFIGQACQTHSLRKVVDVGSGLSYLDEILVRQWNLSVLAIEGNSSHMERARLRTLDLNPASLRLKKAFIANASDLKTCLADFLDDPDEPLSLIGLHCCGDLTPNLLRLFLQLPNLRMISLVPCCYHQIGPQSPNLCLSNASMNSRYSNSLHTHFARRLAAQASVSQWLEQTVADHEAHQIQFGVRAAVQTWVRKHGASLKKRTRRGYRRSDSPRTVGGALEAFWGRFELQSDQESDPADLLSWVLSHEPSFPLLEKLTGLQMSLQLLLENCILWDLVEFLRDNGLTNASLIELFHANISPRNKVLHATKGD